ncbi:reverse transcriptase [Purpureocillium lavendulum]|uniref:Reverse transcriptase n=1 Tax=Purpureocillium lavendulum TaxID=1247861 RepID=A0AB34FBV7_9HYPO|nr:reverse transcriptase [Purpureocillium lavendulum]
MVRERGPQSDLSFIVNGGLTELENKIRHRIAGDSALNREVLLDASKALQASYALAAISNEGDLGLIKIVFTWVHRVSDDYVILLKTNDSGALCIFAFYCVLLKKLEHVWWMEGWGTYLMERIYWSLDSVHRLWIRWPMEEIGWYPGY